MPAYALVEFDACGDAVVTDTAGMEAGGSSGLEWINLEAPSAKPFEVVGTNPIGHTMGNFANTMVPASALLLLVVVTHVVAVHVARTKVGEQNRKAMRDRGKVRAAMKGRHAGLTPRNRSTPKHADSACSVTCAAGPTLSAPRCVS